jgi:hypothetical protein
LPRYMAAAGGFTAASDSAAMEGTA